MTAPSVTAGPLDVTDIRARLTAATSGPSADADLELISHAPEDIKNLLNEVNRLTEALKEIDWLIETVGPDDFVYKVQLVLEDNL